MLFALNIGAPCIGENTNKELIINYTEYKAFLYADDVDVFLTELHWFMVFLSRVCTMYVTIYDLSSLDFFSYSFVSVTRFFFLLFVFGKIFLWDESECCCTIQEPCKIYVDRKGSFDLMKLPSQRGLQQ